jgi:hypothetical protein
MCLKSPNPLARDKKEENAQRHSVRNASEIPNVKQRDKIGRDSDPVFLMPCNTQTNIKFKMTDRRS